MSCSEYEAIQFVGNGANILVDDMVGSQLESMVKACKQIEFDMKTI